MSFPNTKINRPKIDLTDEENRRLLECFDLIEKYQDITSPCIFTNIVINYKKDDERFILSRTQQILSSVLLRSLYIKNGIIDAINSRNIVSLFANLKSFMEVPALLMYLNLLIEQDINSEELLEKFLNIVLGNKGEGELRVGDRESVNIMTMFEKLDKYIKKLSDKSDKKDVDKKRYKNIMTDFYSSICNASHPNYDAHNVVGNFVPKEGVWKGMEIKEFKQQIITDSPSYVPSLNATIIMVKLTCKLILDQKKVDNFKKLSNPKYFEVY